MKNFLNSMFPPKWKRSDARERLAAIREMDPSEAEVLEEVARTDEDAGVRREACNRLGDVPTLRRIAESSEDPELAEMATQRANDLLRERVMTADDWNAALAEVSNQPCICEILLATDNVDLRAAAAERLTNHDAVMSALTHECGKDVGLQLLERIMAEGDLESLVKNGGNKAVRHAAKDRLDAMRPAIEEEEAPVDCSIDDDLTEIVDYAESVTETYNFEGVGAILEERRAKWLSLDPETSHALYPRFKKALDIFKSRRTEFEAKQASKKAHEQEQLRLTEEKEAIIHALENLAATDENAGSEAERLMADWETVPVLEDEDAEEELGRRFKTATRAATEGVQAVAAESAELDRLTELCVKLEEIAASDDVEQLRKYAKRTWRDPQWKVLDPDSLKRRFEAAVKAIAEAVAAKDEAREQEREKNVTELKGLIAQVQDQVDAENRRQASSVVKGLQDQWKALGGWEHALLARDFKAALDAFWEKQREFRDEQEWAHWHNKGVKDKLIEIVEATASMEDPKKVAKIIQNAQKKWKETGPVPHDVSDQMWDRFHAACDANYERCKEFFAEQEKEREENLEVCLKLCEEAEALCTSEDWGKAVNRFKEMQQHWKAHGSLPREKADDTYAKFRTACDKFFERFGGHRQDIDSHREENQAAKEALVVEAKALAESEESVTDPAACIALQTRWKELGPGVKEKDAETWSAFRVACDAFFERLEAAHEKNVPEKEKLCEEVEALVSGLDDDANRKKIADAIIGFQKRWKELGPFPKSYKGDASKRFRKACNSFFDLRRKEYADMADERERNLAIKRDLVAKAEELADSEDWRETAATLKNLQAEWKSIGPVPREHDKEIWGAFRAACDAFFNRRKGHFDTMDSRREDNLHAKEELLVELEQLVGSTADDEKDSADSNSGLDLAAQLQAALESNFAMASGGQSKHDEVRRIQERWKNVGPVPRKKDDELWNRYRALLDKFYGNKPK